MKRLRRTDRDAIFANFEFDKQRGDIFHLDQAKTNRCKCHRPIFLLLIRALSRVPTISSIMLHNAPIRQTQRLIEANIAGAPTLRVTTASILAWIRVRKMYRALPTSRNRNIMDDIDS